MAVVEFKRDNVKLGEEVASHTKELREKYLNSFSTSHLETA